MILSMTGYGEVQCSDDGVSYALEIRSLNGKYYKANIKLPEHLSIFEGEVDKVLRSRMTRGSITYTLRTKNTRADAAQEINVAAVQSYLKQLEAVPASEGMRIDLATVLALPGVCQPPDISEAERQHQWAVIEKLTHQAIDHLIEMRRVEGLAIREDLLTQCQSIRSNLDALRERSPLVVKDYHQKLLQRANELIAEARLSLQMDDLIREVALYAERSDINEEITRLSTHLVQFSRLCDSNERAGRKLEFLAQELLREANTIGSKSNDADMALRIVEIKGAIDRLKEQVLNVE